MSQVDGPNTAFGIDGMRYDGTTLALDQHLSAALVDHRGELEMPAYAVMAESVTSGVYWYSFTESVASVQAWLALTAGARARVGDDLRAVAELSYRDEEHGTALMTITGGGNAVVCTGVARAIRVGRSTEALRAIDKTAPAAPKTRPVPAPTNVPDPLDPGWDGGRILSALARGDIAAGPLSELLATNLRVTEAGPVLEVLPADWMANPLGAIQGGVMASLVGHACALAGQAHTGPGDRYTLADMAVFYFRSPLVDGRPLTLTTATERVGRRLATVSTTMSDSAGTVYARATADVSYDRA